MEIGSRIQDKLITDFQALRFSNNAVIFSNVKKFYGVGLMKSLDCLIIPDSTPEIVEGQSAGNMQTTRVYTYRAIVNEVIEESESDSSGSVKYSRLLNVTDAILDYLQKEPSNLNSWGQSNSINIFKIRVDGVRYDTVQTKSGYAVLVDISFGIYLNIVPQLL